jgi:hypothetical protein
VISPDHRQRHHGLWVEHEVVDHQAQLPRQVHLIERHRLDAGPGVEAWQEVAQVHGGRTLAVDVYG